MSMGTLLPTTSDHEEDSWELRHDEDGFTYKIRKRRHSDSVALASVSSLMDSKVGESVIRKRRLKTFVMLRNRYREEIESWQHLSNLLRVMEQRCNDNSEARNVEPASGVVSMPVAVSTTVGPHLFLIDDLLLQVEMQEVIIRDISNLCDAAEAVYNTRKERMTESFVNLPIWSSPREIMASLCDK